MPDLISSLIGNPQALADLLEHPGDRSTGPTAGGGIPFPQQGAQQQPPDLPPPPGAQPPLQVPQIAPRPPQQQAQPDHQGFASKLGGIFKTLTGVKLGETMRQMHTDMKVGEALINQGITQGDRGLVEQGITVLAKHGGKPSKDFMAEMQRRADLHVASNQPQLNVPNLTPPPGSGGGWEEGHIGFTPEESAVRKVNAQIAAANAEAPLNQQQFNLKLAQLNRMIGPERVSQLSPQDITEYMQKGIIPYAPMIAATKGTNIINAAGQQLGQGQRDPIILGENQNALDRDTGALIGGGPRKVVPIGPGVRGFQEAMPQLTPPPGMPNLPTGQRLGTMQIGQMQSPGLQQVAEGGPPPLPPEMRAAVSAYSKAFQQDPATVDLEKAVAWFKELSDPLGTAVKKSTLATQALGRLMQQAELDIANDSDVTGYLADRFRTTGQMPALGNRSTLIRSSILSDAAKKARAEGATGEADAIGQSAFKANQAALTDMTRQQNRIEQFEKTAGKNLDLFVTQAKKIVDSGSPLINQPLRSIQKNIAGDPRMAAFEAARTTAFTEVSRVLSGTMGQQLSDTARQEANHILSGDYTIPQMMAAVQVLRQDMGNRMEALKGQTQQIKSQMGKGTNVPNLPPPPGTPPTVNTQAEFDALPSGTIYIEDGKKMRKP